MYTVQWIKINYLHFNVATKRSGGIYLHDCTQTKMNGIFSWRTNKLIQYFTFVGNEIASNLHSHVLTYERLQFIHYYNGSFSW